MFVPMKMSEVFCWFLSSKSWGKDSIVQIGFLYWENTGTELRSGFATWQEFAVTFVVHWSKVGIEVLLMSPGALSSGDDLESLAVASSHHVFYLLLLRDPGSQTLPEEKKNVNLPTWDTD